MSSRPLAEVKWTRRPRVPIALTYALVGFSAFVSLVAALRFALHLQLAWAPLRVGLMIFGFGLVGGAISYGRSKAARGAKLVVACRPDGLGVGTQTIPWAQLRAIRYGQVEATSSVAAGRHDKAQDAVLEIATTTERIRLLAVDTVVSDFEAALAPAVLASPEATIGPFLPRSWK